MYLLIIFFLILIVPFLVMPKDISGGEKSPYRVVVEGAIGICAASAVVFMVATVSGQGVLSQMQDTIKTMADSAANDPTIIDILNLSETEKSERVKMFVDVYNVALMNVPAYILTLGTIVAYIEYIILSRSLGKRSQVRLMPKFREFSFPRSAITGIIVMYLVSWLLTVTEVVPDKTLYVNMDFIFDFAFSLQGISVIFMLFYMKRIPKILGVLLALIMWSTLIGRTTLVLIGLIDMMLGLKVRLQNGKPRR